MHMRSHDDITLRDNRNNHLSGTPTVLIAEDSSSVRTLVTCQLRALGYEVLSAADGFEAQEIIRKVNGRKIDLLITDRHMPRLSGDDLVNWVRKEKPDTRVIIMSTCGDTLPDHAAFLQKPFTLISLHRTVRDTPNHSTS
jgi:CheY-like chemotaxis protein